MRMFILHFKLNNENIVLNILLRNVYNIHFGELIIDRVCEFNIMELTKKKRGENWSSEEKEILRQLIAQSAKILEDKSTKTNVNILKTKEWKNVTNKFNEIAGKFRTEGELKLAWKRMKLAAKANLSLHRREQFQTGGGGKPPSPSPEDLQIMAIAPHDFVININDYDSDTMTPYQPETANSPIAGPSSEDPVIVIITEDESKDPEPNDKEKQVVSKHEILEEKKSNSNQKDTSQKKRKEVNVVSKNRTEEGRQAIINSNVNFKKRQLEMLEIEHDYNIQISKLKIKKLHLEIALLENQMNTGIPTRNSSTEE